MIHCDQALELISARLDGALTPQEDAALEAHLAQCPQCRALLADLSALRAACAGLEPPVPADLTARIMAQLAKEAAGEPSPSAPATQQPPQNKSLLCFLSFSKERKWRSWAATAAVFALILAGAGRVWQTSLLGTGSGTSGAAPAAEPSADGIAGGGTRSPISEQAGAPELASPEAVPEQTAPATDTDNASQTKCTSYPNPQSETQPACAGEGSALPETAAPAGADIAAGPQASDPPAPAVFTAGRSGDTGPLDPQGALDALLAQIDGSYTLADLPDNTVGCLLFPAAGTAPDWTCGALVYTGPLDDGGFCFHLHTYAQKPPGPDGQNADYLCYTLDAAGTLTAVQSFGEDAPCGCSGIF